MLPFKTRAYTWFIKQDFWIYNLIPKSAPFISNQMHDTVHVFIKFAFYKCRMLLNIRHQSRQKRYCVSYILQNDILIILAEAVFKLLHLQHKLVTWNKTRSIFNAMHWFSLILVSIKFWLYLTSSLSCHIWLLPYEFLTIPLLFYQNICSDSIIRNPINLWLFSYKTFIKLGPVQKVSLNLNFCIYCLVFSPILGIQGNAFVRFFPNC